MKLHTDGTICQEGTRKVPRNYIPCCEEFNQRTMACVFDIRYEWWSSIKRWVICIDDSAGGGGITISHCPHCGVLLTKDLNQKDGRRTLI